MGLMDDVARGHRVLSSAMRPAQRAALRNRLNTEAAATMIRLRPNEFHSADHAALQVAVDAMNAAVSPAFDRFTERWADLGGPDAPHGLVEQAFAAAVLDVAGAGAQALMGASSGVRGTGGV